MLKLGWPGHIPQADAATKFNRFLYRNERILQHTKLTPNQRHILRKFENQTTPTQPESRYRRINS